MLLRSTFEAVSPLTLGAFAFNQLRTGDRGYTILFLTDDISLTPLAPVPLPAAGWALLACRAGTGGPQVWPVEPSGRLNIAFCARPDAGKHDRRDNNRTAGREQNEVDRRTGLAGGPFAQGRRP